MYRMMLICRSELAREKLLENAIIQSVRVIVIVHREQARSHSFFLRAKKNGAPTKRTVKP